MPDLKITTYASGAGSLPDNPSDSGYSAAEIKAALDSRSDNEIKQKHNALVDEVQAHESAVNPHGITADTIGLGDVDARISTAVAAHEGKVNPHGITAETVGLGSVDNTADLEKPVSNPTKDFIAAQVPALVSSAMTSLGAVRVETTTYTGTGTYGASGANSLTFSGTPIIVFIMPRQSLLTRFGGYLLGNKGFTWRTTACSETATNMSEDYCTVTAVFEGNTVTWYNPLTVSTSSPNMQMNSRNAVYDVLALVI